jgi:hypothetical protein
VTPVTCAGASDDTIDIVLLMLSESEPMKALSLVAEQITYSSTH